MSSGSEGTWQELESQRGWVALSARPLSIASPRNVFIPFLPNLCSNKWFIRHPVNDFGCVAPW